MISVESQFVLCGIVGYSRHSSVLFDFSKLFQKKIKEPSFSVRGSPHFSDLDPCPSKNESLRSKKCIEMSCSFLRKLQYIIMYHNISLHDILHCIAIRYQSWLFFTAAGPFSAKRDSFLAGAEGCVQRRLLDKFVTNIDHKSNQVENPTTMVTCFLAVQLAVKWSMFGRIFYSTCYEIWMLELVAASIIPPESWKTHVQIHLKIHFAGHFLPVKSEKKYSS